MHINPQWEDLTAKKYQFYPKMACKWTLPNPGEMAFSLGDLNGHVQRQVGGFMSVYGGYEIGERNLEVRRLLEFCNEKALHLGNTWF